jgi:hypothetical protein
LGVVQSNGIFETLQRQTDELIEENNEMPVRLQIPHVLLLEK